MGDSQKQYPAIAVAGHLVKDEIVTPSGKVEIALGGTAYNIAALASIHHGIILPICRISRDIAGMAQALFASSPRFDLGAISQSNCPQCVHRLRYKPDGSREEWNSGHQAPLELIDSVDECDGILMNFISGKDVSLKNFKSFRSRYRGLIYLDYHSLSLGMRNNIRYLRYHPRWRDYISLANIVQMNLAELGSIMKLSQVDEDRILKSCEEIHSLGPSIVIITRGRDGVIALIEGSGVCKVSAPAIGIEVDPTGCGDTLSAAFLSGLLLTGDFSGSLLRASLLAAAKATFSGLDGFENIEEISLGFKSPAEVEWIEKE